MAQKSVGTAAEDVISLASKFQSILDMAEVLKGMASIENATSERQQGLVQATSDHEAMLKKLDMVKNQVADVEKRLADDLEEHKKAVADVSARAEGESKALIDQKMADANAKASEMVISARREASRVELASQTASAAVEIRLSKARDETKRLEDGLPALRTEFADLDRKIGDLRKIAQSITG